MTATCNSVAAAALLACGCATATKPVAAPTARAGLVLLDAQLLAKARRRALDGGGRGHGRRAVCVTIAPDGRIAPLNPPPEQPKE
jgi:hypothetical protein